MLRSSVPCDNGQEHNKVVIADSSASYIIAMTDGRVSEKNSYEVGDGIVELLEKGRSYTVRGCVFEDLENTSQAREAYNRVASCFAELELVYPQSKIYTDRKMKQQFIGLQHCKCDMSRNKKADFFFAFRGASASLESLCRELRFIEKYPNHRHFVPNSVSSGGGSAVFLSAAGSVPVRPKNIFLRLFDVLIFVLPVFIYIKSFLLFYSAKV